jgi:ATP-binding cassette subfamily B protein
LKYTFVKQHDATDCAAACLAMVCLFYKKETTITRLRDKMGTDLKGSNMVGLSKCAEELGFTTQAIRVDREGFLSKYSLPTIANVITKEGLAHFVVVFKVSEKYVVIGDPAKDMVRITVDEFYKDFTGAMLILKPDQSFASGKLKGQGIFQRYIGLLLPQKKLFAYGIIASFILTMLGIVSSLFNNIIYDEILPYKQENTLKMVIAVFAGVGVTQIILRFVRQWMMIHLSQKIDIPLMLGYFEHIYKLPMRFFAARKRAISPRAFPTRSPSKMYLQILRLL